jgi:hypothetical protein
MTNKLPPGVPPLLLEFLWDQNAFRKSIIADFLTHANATCLSAITTAATYDQPNEFQWRSNTIAEYKKRIKIIKWLQSINSGRNYSEHI